MPHNRVYFTIAKVPDRATQSTLGRRLLGQMVAELSGLSEDLFGIAPEPSGRLIVAAKDGSQLGVFVSLSHTGPALACAATMLGPIGIDIEQHRAGRNIAGIAESAFGPAERQRCAHEGAPGFYRIWTLREAMAKASGAGLAMVGDRHDRAAEGPDEGSWQWHNWRLIHRRLGDDMSFAIAVLPRDQAAGEVLWHNASPALTRLGA